MGSADLVDDRTFNGDFSDGGVVKLKEIVMDKLKEYMGDYTDDTLVEYVIVLLRNGRRKEEANNELKIFLGDDSDSFVAWLWDHISESGDEYFNSRVEKTTVKSSLISSQNEDKALAVMDSEPEKGRSRRGRQWKSQPTNVSEVPPLLSSEVHKIHNYDEKKDHKHRQNKRSPSPQSQSDRKRSRTDDSRNEQREAKPPAKPDVSRRLLQFAVRDALAIPKPANSSTESSLKRLRSVVSTSTQESSDPNPARKIRSVARVVNPMASIKKAIAEAAEDAKKPKPGRSVFDRISQSTSETLDRHMVLGKVSPKNEECRNISDDPEAVHPQYTHRLDNNGVHVENMPTFDTGLQPKYVSDRGRLGSSANFPHPSTFLGNRINNPNSLQHRLVDDPKRVKGMNYRNHLTEGATRQKTASFSGNVDTGKTVKLEGQMEVPDMGLQRYMDEGRMVSSETITQSAAQSDTIGNGNIKRAVNAKEDSTTNKSVPVAGTLSTTRPLEDASSRTIFVANVHFGATKDSLSRHFNKCGEVLKAIIVTDPATGQPSGSAYIEFTRKEAAENALSLDGTSFMSRILKIVKGSSGQQQEAASSMTWSRGGRFARAPAYFRGGSALRGRSVARAGGRSMQWKRDSAETGNNNAVGVAPNNARSLTYVRTDSKSDD